MIEGYRPGDDASQAIAAELDYRQQLDFVFTVSRHAMPAMTLSAPNVPLEPWVTRTNSASGVRFQARDPIFSASSSPEKWSGKLQWR